MGDKSNFFLNDRVAREMQRSAAIEKARNDFYKTGLTESDGEFGVQGLKDAGLNPIQQFVGTFHYVISVNLEGNFLQYTITNTTSFASGAFHLVPYSWNWHSGPMSNTQQTIIFTEPIK